MEEKDEQATEFWSDNVFSWLQRGGPLLHFLEHVLG